jgi:H+/Cl- antiporter ClcA
MASAYHAPLAGSLFIAEILFGTLMLASLGPVVIAAVVALLTTQLLAPGAGTLYAVHLSGILTAADYALLVAMGLVAGLCGPLLMWLMDVQPRAFPAPQAFAAVAAGAGRCDRRAAVSSHAEGVGEWLQRGSGFSARPAAAVGDCRGVYL